MIGFIALRRFVLEEFAEASRKGRRNMTLGFVAAAHDLRLDTETAKRKRDDLRRREKEAAIDRQLKTNRPKYVITPVAVARGVCGKCGAAVEIRPGLRWPVDPSKLHTGFFFHRC